MSFLKCCVIIYIFIFSGLILSSIYLIQFALEQEMLHNFSKYSNLKHSNLIPKVNINALYNVISSTSKPNTNSPLIPKITTLIINNITTKSFEEFKMSRLKQIFDFHANNILNDSSTSTTMVQIFQDAPVLIFINYSNYSTNKIYNPKLELFYQFNNTTKSNELLTKNMTFIEKLYNYFTFS